MAENGIHIESMRQQSRYKDYKTLQSYIQLSDEKVKKDYENGLSFNRSEGNLSTADIPKMHSNNRTEATSNAYTILAEKYVKGLFSKEQFL